MRSRLHSETRWQARDGRRGRSRPLHQGPMVPTPQADDGFTRASRRAADHAHSTGGGHVFRISITCSLLAVGMALGLGAPTAQAQLVEVTDAHRFEFTPFAGYQWG